MLPLHGATAVHEFRRRKCLRERALGLQGCDQDESRRVVFRVDLDCRPHFLDCLVVVPGVHQMAGENGSPRYVQRVPFDRPAHLDHRLPVVSERLEVEASERPPRVA